MVLLKCTCDVPLHFRSARSQLGLGIMLRQATNPKTEMAELSIIHRQIDLIEVLETTLIARSTYGSPIGNVYPPSFSCGIV